MIDDETLDSDAGRLDHRAETREIARMRVFGPAMGFLVVAIFSFIVGLYYCTFAVVQMKDMYETQRSGIEKRNIPAQQKDMMLNVHDSTTQTVLVAVPIFGAITAFLGLLFGIAGWQLYYLRGRTFGFVFAIIGLIPCFLASIFSIPVGIWTLLVLNDPDVQDAMIAT